MIPFSRPDIPSSLLLSATFLGLVLMACSTATDAPETPDPGGPDATLIELSGLDLDLTESDGRGWFDVIQAEGIKGLAAVPDGSGGVTFLPAEIAWRDGTATTILSVGTDERSFATTFGSRAETVDGDRIYYDFGTGFDLQDGTGTELLFELATPLDAMPVANAGYFGEAQFSDADGPFFEDPTASRITGDIAFVVDFAGGTLDGNLDGFLLSDGTLSDITATLTGRIDGNLVAADLVFDTVPAEGYVPAAGSFDLGGYFSGLRGQFADMIGGGRVDIDGTTFDMMGGVDARIFSTGP